MMTTQRSGLMVTAFSISIACLLPLSSQTAPPHALTLPLKCASGDCSLLHGVPQTAGMRSGFVRLKPGDSVGWHTTGQNEESLVILRGRGHARRRGGTLLQGAGVCLYPSGNAAQRQEYGRRGIGIRVRGGAGKGAIAAGKIKRSVRGSTSASSGKVPTGSPSSSSGVVGSASARTRATRQ